LGLARGTRLATIPGRLPDATARDAGCAFAARCNWADAACAQAVPPPREIAPAHHVRCVHPLGPSMLHERGMNAA
jgi:peptide/nickel transport system ATP-binding protein